jgi:hypothetical protein
VHKPAFALHHCGTRKGTVRYGVVWYDMVWYGMERNGSDQGLFVHTSLSIDMAMSRFASCSVVIVDQNRSEDTELFASRTGYLHMYVIMRPTRG